MSDEELLGALLDLINVPKGDDWWKPCCRYCYDDPWHKAGERVTDSNAGEGMWRHSTPRCRCVCHDARARLSIEDDVHDERWTVSRRAA